MSTHLARWLQSLAREYQYPHELVADTLQRPADLAPVLGLEESLLHPPPPPTPKTTEQPARVGLSITPLSAEEAIPPANNPMAPIGQRLRQAQRSSTEVIADPQQPPSGSMQISDSDFSVIERERESMPP